MTLLGPLLLSCLLHTCPSLTALSPATRPTPTHTPSTHPTSTYTPSTRPTSLSTSTHPTSLSTSTRPTTRPLPQADGAVLVLLGDLMPVRRVALPTAQQIASARQLWQGAHQVIGNLEAPLGPCLAGGTTQHPRLCTDQTRLRTLRDIGIRAVTLANNHMLDAGKEGLQRTRNALQRLSIRTSHPTNACLAQEHIQILRLRVGPYPVTLLAINTIRPHFPPKGFPPLPTDKSIQDCIRQLSKQDTLIVSFHAGQEYRSFPSPKDAALFRAAWKAGAKAIFAHHPHVPRSFVVHRGVPLAWGLGNAVSDQRHPVAVRTGLLLRLHFSGPLHAPILSAKTLAFQINNGWPRPSSNTR